MTDKKEKIPYQFDPIPTYFRQNGWFKNINCMAYICWAFSRCSSTSRKTYFNHKQIELGPFEYISGRDACSREIGISPQNIRTVQNQLTKGGLLEKLTTKSTSKFTVYRWVTERFSENINQQINQQLTSNQPATNHNPDVSDVKNEDVSKTYRQCGNVHNFSEPSQSESSFAYASFDSSRSGSSLNDFDHARYADEFKFPDGSFIKKAVLTRWMIAHGPEEVYYAIRHYEKMSKKKLIPKPEAYVQTSLKKRYWETEQMRDKARQKEKNNKEDKKKRKDQFA